MWLHAHAPTLPQVKINEAIDPWGRFRGKTEGVRWDQHARVLAVRLEEPRARPGSPPLLPWGLRSKREKAKIIGLLYKCTHGIGGVVPRIFLAVPIGELVPTSRGAGCRAGAVRLFLAEPWLQALGAAEEVVKDIKGCKGY